VWFKFAADRGDASGKWNLALCYDKGIGVAPDGYTAQRLRSEASHSPPVNPSVYFIYLSDFYILWFLNGMLSALVLCCAM
jgi:hypothetical protein